MGRGRDGGWRALLPWILVPILIVLAFVWWLWAGAGGGFEAGGEYRVS